MPDSVISSCQIDKYGTGLLFNGMVLCWYLAAVKEVIRPKCVCVCVCVCVSSLVDIVACEYQGLQVVPVSCACKIVLINKCRGVWC